MEDLQKLRDPPAIFRQKIRSGHKTWRRFGRYTGLLMSNLLFNRAPNIARSGWSIELVQEWKQKIKVELIENALEIRKISGDNL